jgi:hypothetical protein
VVPELGYRSLTEFLAWSPLPSIGRRDSTRGTLGGFF